MYVLFRVTVTVTRYSSETAERFILYKSNPCTAGSCVLGGSCQQVVTVTLTHILIVDVPSVNSGSGGNGTTSDQKLHNCFHILSVITEIKVKKKKNKERNIYKLNFDDPRMEIK
jgi:hypothetical protein